jgi:hypothetical protein
MTDIETSIIAPQQVGICTVLDEIKVGAHCHVLVDGVQELHEITGTKAHRRHIDGTSEELGDPGAWAQLKYLQWQTQRTDDGGQDYKLQFSTQKVSA